MCRPPWCTSRGQNVPIGLASRLYRFFHPPRCPGAPPLLRGEGPNSGPDWRESVGWITLLALPNGLTGFAPSGRKGRDSGPCISSRWGLWTFDEGLPVDRPSPRPSPREERGEGEEEELP